LLDYVLSGDIEHGAKIPSERQLAEALGVGRSAVREAIKSLNVLGLLDVRQGDGTYLRQSGSSLLLRVIEWGLLLDEPRVQDMIEARIELEIVVAGLAAIRATDEDVALLRQCLEAMKAAGDDVEAYVEAEIAFHLQVARTTRNEAFVNLVSSLSSLLRVWTGRVLRHAGETRTSASIHEPLVEAIAAGHPEQAREATKAYMDREQGRLRDALEAHDEPARSR
jgi:GntR family transcriptional repressor for pyruvate dehydrogenase complex